MLFRSLLIESTGISEPLPVAETFTFRDEQGRRRDLDPSTPLLVLRENSLDFLCMKCNAQIDFPSISSL